MDENKLILKVKNDGCDESFKILSKKHSGICLKVIERYAKVFETIGVPPIDVYNDKDYIIFECIQKFDPTKNIKFVTFLSNWTRYYCLNKINANNQYVAVGDDVLTQTIELGTDYEKEKVNKNLKNRAELVNSIIEKFNDKRLERIFKMRYFTKDSKNTPWRVISKELNLTIPAIINLHNQAKSVICKEISSSKLLDTV